MLRIGLLLFLAIQVPIMGATVVHIGFFEDDGATSFRDLSGSGNNATCTGAGCPTLWPMGKHNQKAYFDGTNDYLQIGANVVSDDFTLSAWVRRTASLTNNGSCSTDDFYCGFGVIDAEVGGQTDDYGLSIKDNKPIFGVGATSILGTTLISDQWYHIAGTRKRSTGDIKLYINGKQAASGTSSTIALTGPSALNIGADSVTSVRGYYQGYLREVRVWNHTLTRHQIRSEYHRTRPSQWHILHHSY